MARTRDGACETGTEGRRRRKVDACDGVRVTAEWQGRH